jgi:hypothetical protein
MITRFAIFTQAEDATVCRVFGDQDFATEPEAEAYLNKNLSVFGDDKIYLVIKIRRAH